MRRVLWVATLLLTAAIAAPVATAGHIEVLQESVAGSTITTLTFEGAAHGERLHEDHGYMPPGSGMRFNADWVAATMGAFANQPSGETVALWIRGQGVFDVEPPAAEVGLWYSAADPATLQAFDADGNLLGSASGPANAKATSPEFSVWDPLVVEADGHVIARVVIPVTAGRMLVDDIHTATAVDEEPVDSCLEAILDVRPGSDANPINIRAKGVIPMAILSSEGFDAADVDPESILVRAEGSSAGGAQASRSALEDVDGDGLADLVFHVPTASLAEDGGVDGATKTLQVSAATSAGLACGSDVVAVKA